MVWKITFNALSAHPLNVTVRKYAMGARPMVAYCVEPLSAHQQLKRHSNDVLLAIV